jgi:drug/metabolite transporter (DMT)-like permease
LSASVVGLALLAAILHASWNAFLRTGGDRLWTITVMSLSGIVVGLPFAVLYPWPEPSAWLYIFLSAGLQVGYILFLVAAYRYGELGQVYPIVRGTVPMLVTLGGFLLTGQQLGIYQTIGVVLVAVGIMTLSLGSNRAPTTSMLLAFATGAIIATYATVDSIGVRHAGHAGAYAAWVLITYGLGQVAAFVVLRGRLVLDLRSSITWKALGGGIVALIAYGLVIVAYTLGPAGPVTALRETSVIFAALIGWLFLGESLTRRRALACVIVALGAIFIGYQR